MKTPDHLDLSDLPEPIANGLAVVAEMARVMNATHPPEASGVKAPFSLPVFEGKVFGSLSREAIYDAL
jgi:hypothetical protein